MSILMRSFPPSDYSKSITPVSPAPYPLSPYPKEIGHYTNDMPKMARWEEREKLLKEAQKNSFDSTASRRLKLWDYFFQVNSQEIGKPQRNLIVRLKNNLTELYKIKADLLDKKYQIEQEVYQLLVDSRRSNRRTGGVMLIGGVFAIFIGLIAINNVGARGFGVLALLGALFLWIIGGSLYFSNRGEPSQRRLQEEVEKRFAVQQVKLEKRAREIVDHTNAAFAVALDYTPSNIEVKRNEIELAVKKEQDQARNQRIGGIIVGGLICLTGVGAFIGIPIIVISFLATNQKLAPSYVEIEVDKRLTLAYASIKEQSKSNLPPIMNQSNTVEGCIQLTKEQIQGLEGEISYLISQIPKGASDREVDTWFINELKELEKIAVRETGMMDRLANINYIKKETSATKEETNTSNDNSRLVHSSAVANNEAEDNDKQRIFCIHGPAKFQSDVPREYKQDIDNKHHITAQRLAYFNDLVADFYGVYYIEYLLVGIDVLAVYSVFYDFIMNRRFSPKTRVLHYLDVVTVQTAQDYLARELPDGEKLELDGVPSLTLTLTSGEHIDIHYPAFDHLQKPSSDNEEAESAPVFYSVDRWKFNMEKYARNANKHIQEQMHSIKNQRRGL